MKKIKFYLLLAFFTFTFKAISQKTLKDTSSLQISKFHTRIGVFRKDSLWDIKKEIRLPSQPTFISVSVNGRNLQPNLICILSEEIKIYDTIQVSDNNTVNFFNLSGGNYKLTFINQNNGEHAKISFSIEPVFWERWWFSPFLFLIISIILGVTFYFIYLIRLRQHLRTQNIRDNIARDLHDDMGSYLSSISILSQNVEQLALKDPEKARQSLRKIGETARQVMDTMGDIVWSINPSQDSMEQIINHMKDFGIELFFSQDVEIDFSASESVKKTNLSLEKRRDFFLIYKEALTNIQKYAHATQIKVQIQSHGNQISLQIEDNGKGFDIESLPKTRASGGNGLKNMQSRAEKLDGKIKIESQKGLGTSIKLEFEQ